MRFLSRLWTVFFYYCIPAFIALLAPASAVEECLNLPGADNVLVILKTGATELYAKLPIHLRTTLTCIPHFIVVSDLEQTLDGISIHDVIAPVSEKTRSSHAEFDLYRQIQEWHRSGQDVSQLDAELGWDLDKWKFLPMIHRAWEFAAPLQKKIEWYVMIEADTSLSWLNLLIYLQDLDPEQPQYMGVPTILVKDQTAFAHGGSGVIMSKAAVEKLEDRRRNTLGGPTAYDVKWEKRTKKVCRGDAILAHAFTDVGVNVTRAWPMIQGETPLTLPWTAKHMCQPAITWHHVDSAQVDRIWQYQTEWVREHGGWDEPYLYLDMFERFVEPHLTDIRAEWDNLCDDMRLEYEDKDYPLYIKVDREALLSAEGCARTCEMRPGECVQWKWTPGKCYLGEDVRLGKRIVLEDDAEESAVNWTSGWMLDRIASFKASFGGCEAASQT